MSKLIELLKGHEGTGPVLNGRLMPYEDSKGYLTIGYGRCIELIGITEDEADYLLSADIKRTQEECEKEFKWFNELNKARKAVVISIVFNIGMPKFAGKGGHPGFKKTINYLDQGYYVSAGNEMLDSKWAKQVGSHRSGKLAEMMRQGEWL